MPIDLNDILSVVAMGGCILWINTLVKHYLQRESTAKSSDTTGQLIAALTQAMTLLVAERACQRDPVANRIMTSGVARALNIPGGPMWPGSPAYAPESVTPDQDDPSNEDLASMREVLRGDQQFETVGP